MSVDLIALMIFLLGLAFWTGVLHNRICNLTKRLDKNDETTANVPIVLTQMQNIVAILGELKTDIHEIKDDMTAMKTDIALLKKERRNEKMV